jgi:outer membrane protein OmpA-like peptidoglycan-associated protein
MVFTRRVNRQEDLYQSRKIEGEWQEASPLTELNTPGNEAAHCLSPDGNTLVFTSCDRRDAYGSCDLYESHFINGKWTEPAIMGKEINTRFWDSQPSITSDGQVLYFSSKRPGGYGAKDIWFSVKDENGRWTKARNAGAVINTKGNEESPFIHPDNFTLYFMSDGHPGMGNSDLFVAYFDGDQWQKPRNLGYPINSEAEEGAIRVAADGKTAFFSTDRFSGASEPKNLDIYSFTLPLEIQAQAVGYVKGRVINKENGSALSLELNLSDNTKGKLIRKIYSDNEGSFLFPIPAGYSYNLWVDHPDYIYHSEHFEAGSEHDKAEALLLEIALIPVKSGEEETEAVILNNIFFDSGSAAIDLKKSYLELDNLTSFLKKNSGIHIEIRGHTDNVGKEEDNLLLSENRAKALYDYLVLNGIDSNRLEYMGFGESRPIADNSSEEGRKLNRRTEFIVLSSLSR